MGWRRPAAHGLRRRVVAAAAVPRIISGDPMVQRNVLLTVVDQWRADCMAYLGTEHLRMPNIDRLCREAVTCRDHVTAAVPTGPARAGPVRTPACI